MKCYFTFFLPVLALGAESGAGGLVGQQSSARPGANLQLSAFLGCSSRKWVNASRGKRLHPLLALNDLEMFSVSFR